MKTLPKEEEVTALRTYLKASIESFTEDNAVFKDEFEDHLAIIRRFDEVLLEKANKHSVTELDAKISDEVKTIALNCEEKVNNSTKALLDTKEDVEQ